MPEMASLVCSVLAQDRLQHVGEAEPDLVVYRNLVHAFELVFDRIFHGNDFLFDRIDLAQAGVKRGRLAAAGGAGDEKNPGGIGENMLEPRQRVGVEAEKVEVVYHARLVEDADHDALAVQDRHRRYADIDIAPGFRRNAARRRRGSARAGPRCWARDGCPTRRC